MLCAYTRKSRKDHDMSTLLHISASPRGTASESRAIAATFLDAYRDAHPDDEIVEWDLWDGTLPEFGPAAAAAKMARSSPARTRRATRPAPGRPRSTPSAASTP